MDYAIHLSTQLREHLRALRKKRGLTQAALGRLLGVGQARVAEIENNPGVVSVDQLIRVLSALQTALVLRDGAVKTEHSPLGNVNMGKVAPSESPPQPVGPPAVMQPPTGPWLIRPLSGSDTPSVPVNRAGAKTPIAGQILREANPSADVVPTSKRHFIIRPKKGSW